MRLALIGHPGSGKSSIADALGVRVTFARAVKREVAEAILPIARLYVHPQIGELMGTNSLVAHMEDPDSKDAFRRLLQVWGTDFRRAQNPNYWVDQVERQIEALIAADGETTIVVDDCRFPNEREMLERHGFKFVRLESGASTRPLTGEQLAHESERYWPTWPVELTLSYQPGPETQAARIREAFEGSTHGSSSGH